MAESKKVSKEKKAYAEYSRNTPPASSADIIRSKILTSKSPFHVREAYKALRTNVLFSLSDPGCKKIIVTSSYAGEGKSINCLNLAIAFGENGAKVLLIDCDLRRPNVGRLLNIRPEAGLSNVLVGLKEVDDVITHTDYDNLDVIFSGDIPPNPSELLGSAKFDKLIEGLQDKYDYIFLDSPPVTVVSDAVVLSRCATGTILIVRSGRTDKDALENAIGQLEFAGAKILGTILNGTTPGGVSYKYKRRGYGRYSRYYSRYYGRYGSRYYGGRYASGYYARSAEKANKAAKEGKEKKSADKK